MATLNVRVTPRAGRTAIAGRRGDAVLVRLAAAPVDGAANDALVAAIADAFGVSRRQVTILSGHKSRDKRIEIAGLTDAEVTSRLSAILPA
jgi:uncharacterized protein